MFTVCPKCTLTLAVTAGDLRVGQGYVRCGRCSNVFNALLQLTEEPIELHASPAASPPARAPPPLATVGAAAPARPAADTPAAAAAAAPRRTTIPAAPAGAAAPAAASPAPAPPSPAASAVSPMAARTGAPRTAPPTAAATARAAATPRTARSGAAPAPRSPKPQEEAAEEFHIDDIDFPDATGTFESIMLEGDAITRTEGVLSEATAPPSPRAPARRASDAAAKAFVARSRAAVPAAPSSDAAADDPLLEEAAAEEALSDEAAQAKAIAAVLQPSAQRGGWLWIGLCALLAALLIAQMIDHWRNALATSPFWSAPLARVYGALGVPLSPHWDLSAYDVRQQGAQSDPADPRVIRVRLSVANHAARAQPVPLLRLTLLDRYGKPIAARDLTPAEYWPRGRPPDRFLGSDQRIDSEVAVRTATSDSSSFEIDVCLRDARGSVRCAGDHNGVAAAEGARASSGA